MNSCGDQNNGGLQEQKMESDRRHFINVKSYKIENKFLFMFITIEKQKKPDHCLEKHLHF